MERSLKCTWPHILLKVKRLNVEGGRSSGVGRGSFGNKKAVHLYGETGPKSGQAMAEFLVGLVGIMLLVVGLQQISIISRASFESHVDARTQLASQITDPMSDYTGEYLFVDTVNSGLDQKVYTADDMIVEGDAGFFTEGNGFLDRVNYYDLSGFILDSDYELQDPYSRLGDSSYTVLSKSFSMHYGVSEQAVEVVPFLRTVIGQDEIFIKRDAWMPSWGGLMEVVP